MYESEVDDEGVAGVLRRTNGLSGKFDNVRRYWEDGGARLYIQPHLQELVDRRQEEGRGLRILDMGCGVGDGYELLRSVKRSDARLSAHDNVVIKDGLLNSYQGIDINPRFIAEANTVYRERPEITFVHADFNEIDLEADEPYDIYIFAFGTLSHYSLEKSVELISRLGQHGRDGSLILADWLGRFSCEWETLWNNDLSREQWLELKLTGSRSQREDGYGGSDRMKLALLSRQEVIDILSGAREKSGVNIMLRRLYDRSVLVGRELDVNGDDTCTETLRKQVNSLFEPNIRTNLEDLIVDYRPREGFPIINEFYTMFQRGWNDLVDYVIANLRYYDSFGTSPRPEVGQHHSLLQRKIMTEMGRLIANIYYSEVGDVRANTIEPHFGYVLRELEMSLQQGLGCGSGITAILELKK